MQLRTALLAALVLAAGACKSKDAAPAEGAPAADASTPAGASSASGGSSGADGDLKDIASYRLTMDKIDKFYAAQRNLAIKAKGMTPAEREAMESGNAAGADANASLDDIVRRIDGAPPMRDAIRDAGLSSREYVMVMMAAMQSGMAASVIKMRPKDDPDSLAREMKASPENIRFMQEHEAELTQKQKAMEAEMKRMGVDRDG